MLVTPPELTCRSIHQTIREAASTIRTWQIGLEDVNADDVYVVFHSDLGLSKSEFRYSLEKVSRRSKDVQVLLKCRLSPHLQLVRGPQCP